MKSCVAVIVAGGFSSRMRGFKPLLPLPMPIAEGQPSALACLAHSYRLAGISRVMVVSGHRAQEVEAEAQRLGLDSVRNPQPEQGMFSSVRVGLQALLREYAFCFMHPVDIPLVRPLTLRYLWEARHSQRPCVPTFRGQEGHPLLLPAALWEQAAGWGGQHGLRGWLQALPTVNGLVRVPVPDRLTLCDMDTDAAYAVQCQLAQRYDRLDPAECRELLRLHAVPERGVAHGHSVGLVAAVLATALRKNSGKTKNQGAAPLDATLCLSGGLVHDICKGQAQHESRAGLLLRDLHLPRMADLVEEHRDMQVPDGAPLTEKALVYLADKYVQGRRFVTLEQRFGAKLHQFGHDPDAHHAIQGRWMRAQALERRLQIAVGGSPALLAQQVLRQHNTGEGG